MRLTPGLIVEGDDVEGGVAKSLNFRIPIVHQVNLKSFKLIQINSFIFNGKTSCMSLLSIHSSCLQRQQSRS
jgi:hypothetical protein